MAKPSLIDKLDQLVFKAIYSRNLVYNTCWEDPAVDRQALQLGADDTVLAISSAGCNVLDYALLAPRHIFAVDANPRQTALLELKIAGIRNLDYEDFFAVFGDGHHAGFRELYFGKLRSALSPYAQAWWDKHWAWFVNRRRTFYFNGLSGIVARGVRAYFRLRPGLSNAINSLLDAKTLGEQQKIYDEQVAPLLWSKTVNWVISRQFVMSLLGVPYPQRKLVEAQHANGLSGFIREAVEYVFRQLPLADNYFYRLYLTGSYRRDCCPEYLSEFGFTALKAGLVDRLSVHTTTVTEFLNENPTPISRFVLLDHMDWMSSYYPDALVEEWNAILTRATPGARILLRSAHSQPAYLEAIRVGSGKNRLREILRFSDDLANSLQAGDRVHTYAGFVIADAPA
jgi:S-adenosylmethionine-diacylglycerol 3-amino-3-carboxypropyl transferase